MIIKDCANKQIIYSTNVNLDSRWIYIPLKELKLIWITSKVYEFNWYENLDVKKNELRKFNSTRIQLGYDNKLERPVLIKTINYIVEEIKNEVLLKKKRLVLADQVKMLNEIASPLLPEPLDYFYVNNSDEAFESNKYEDDEPVLILEYISGISLRDWIYSKKYYDEEKKRVKVKKIIRSVLNILYFLKTLDKEGYAHIALSSEHVIMLKNEVTRFVGLGSIIKLKNGEYYNGSSRKFVKGYSPPEIRDKRIEKFNGRLIGVFSLGVLMYEMLTGTLVNEDDELIADNGSFKYGLGKSVDNIKKLYMGEKINGLLERLCDHNINERVINFNEIENILNLILGDNKFIFKKGSIGEITFVDNEKKYLRVYDFTLKKDLKYNFANKKSPELVYSENKKISYDIVSVIDLESKSERFMISGLKEVDLNIDYRVNSEQFEELNDKQDISEVFIELEEISALDNLGSSNDEINSENVDYMEEIGLMKKLLNFLGKKNNYKRGR